MLHLLPRMRIVRYALVLFAIIVPLLTVRPALASPLGLQSELVTPGLATYDYDGGAVAISADGATALVGARGYNLFSGLATVFVRSGATWSKQATFSPSDLAGGDAFGTSVTLCGDGNTALVGAPYKTSSSGVVYVFSRMGAAWTQTGLLTAGTITTGDFFGAAVACSTDGNTAAVGVPNRASGPNANVGAVVVFTRSGTGAFTTGPTLTPGDGAAYDNFGSAFAVNGNGGTIVVGAAAKANDTGAAYVFAGSGGSYTGVTLARTDAVIGDYFGGSVAVSADGGTLLVGAPRKTVGTMSSAGAAYVFTGNGTSYTVTMPTLTAADGQPNDQYGVTVALSSDASVAAVSAPYRNSNTGAVYTLARSGMNYIPSQTITGMFVAGSNGYTFGTGLALNADGSTAIFGASGKTQNTGTAYAFNSPGSPPTITAVSPGSGPLVGGTPVTITGTNFQGGAAVSFGAVPATNVVRVSATQLTAIVPLSVTSTAVTVTLTNGDGNTATLTRGYAYVNAAPTPLHATRAPVVGMTPAPIPATHTPAPTQGAATPTPLPAPVRH